jgi:hypothetical protein
MQTDRCEENQYQARTKREVMFKEEEFDVDDSSDIVDIDDIMPLSAVMMSNEHLQTHSLEVKPKEHYFMSALKKL